jgi:hypothetical protein
MNHTERLNKIESYGAAYEKMTLGDWLDIYDRHVPDHIAQMQEVYVAWQQAQ